MKSPKIIIFDLDGTLAESKRPLTSETGNLLARLLEKIPAAVMSGGSFAQFEKQFLSGMPADARFENLYLFPTSAAGCLIFKNGNWEVLYNHAFSKEEKEKIISAIREGIAETHFVQPEKLWGEQIEDRGAEITFSALGQQAPLEIKEAWDPTHEKRMPLWKFLVEKLPDCRVALNATTSIDITKKGIDKAFGIRELSKIMDVAIADMLYVGDALFAGGNDEVVKETGMPTRQVAGPDETAALIETFLAK